MEKSKAGRWMHLPVSQMADNRLFSVIYLYIDYITISDQFAGPVVESTRGIGSLLNYPTDSWTNIPASILSAIPLRLHLKPSHPILLTRQLIESHFPSPKYAHLNTLSPIVTVAQNFDSLGFPVDHPGRSRSDTYYINADTVLRTHTSAHQADTFRENASEGYTISADVYRRDAIDRSHYPVFHQMEGARMWDRRKVLSGDVAKAVREELDQIPKHDMIVEDVNQTVHPQRNPLQEEHHSIEEVEAMATHLKRTLEGVVFDILSHAREANSANGGLEKTTISEPLKIRWVETHFPFTSPSWELEVFWQNSWLELLGCGIVQQRIPIAAGVPFQLGWAFGVGLERVAMMLFSIPDIRLFWSEDARFLKQFSTLEKIRPFVPFSKYPACYKDVAFWHGGSVNSAGGVISRDFHENDFMEIVRETIGGQMVEDVKLVDEFQHPKTGRRSLCYRINYRNLERTLTNQEVNDMQELLERQMESKLGVEVR